MMSDVINNGDVDQEFAFITEWFVIVCNSWLCRLLKIIIVAK